MPITELTAGTPDGIYDVRLADGSRYIFEFSRTSWRISRVLGPAEPQLATDRGAEDHSFECSVGRRLSMSQSTGYGAPMVTGRSGVVESITRLPDGTTINSED